MDENDKDFKEAVEKVIDEREEKRRARMRKAPELFEPIEKKNLVKEAPSPVKKNKMKHIDAILLMIVIAGLLIWVAWPSIMTEETEPVIVYPANVVLDSFNDGSSAGPYDFIVIGGWDPPGVIEIQPDYVSVSFELKNTGDEVASDVSCFIKCCDHNGTILFAQLFTFGDIGPDISASGGFHVHVPATGSYRVPISNETLYVTHSIDVRWSPQGVNTYMKLTEV